MNNKMEFDSTSMGLSAYGMASLNPTKPTLCQPFHIGSQVPVLPQEPSPLLN